MSKPTPAPYPPERSLWRANSPRAAAKLFSGTPAELARIWLWVIGGVFAVVGILIMLFAITLLTFVLGAVLTLLGVAVLLVQLFLFAYSDRAASPGGPRD